MSLARNLAPNLAFDQALADAVAHGLRAAPKTLPPWLFYDEAGSRLFEAITELPEYYPTRTERSILEARAPEIMAAAGHPGCVIELGSGSARKTALLLEAVFLHRPEMVFHPIDVSAAALDEAQEQLGARLPDLNVAPVCDHYLPALEALAHTGGPRLVLFMGSTLGNFEPGEAIAFLRDLRGHLRADDLFLLGLDLEKAPAILVPAYDDAAGVTAAFNLNLLTRLNRELGADFDGESFRHLALWNAAEHRIEMHLESTKAQTVRFAATGLEIAFAEGERIHTENSYKHPPAEVDRLLAEGGFAPVAAWTDARDWFTLRLAKPAPAAPTART